MRQAIQIALARLSLDTAPTVSAPSSAFFRGTAKPSALCIPHPKIILRNYRGAGLIPSYLLTIPQQAGPWQLCTNRTHSLGQMPKVDSFIASFIISPEEAWRPNARCPRPQSRITDDLLSQAYNTAARMGRIENSLCHLMLALSQSKIPSYKRQIPWSYKQCN